MVIAGGSAAPRRLPFHFQAQGGIGRLTLGELAVGLVTVDKLELEVSGTAQPYEKEYLHKNGNRVPVLVGAAKFEEAADQGVAFVLDLTDRKEVEKRARDNEWRYSEMQMELAHANRVATVGQLSSSIAHELSQPISAAVMNGEAGKQKR